MLPCSRERFVYKLACSVTSIDTEMGSVEPLVSSITAYKVDKISCIFELRFLSLSVFSNLSVRKDQFIAGFALDLTSSL